MQLLQDDQVFELKLDYEDPLHVDSYRKDSWQNTKKDNARIKKLLE